MCFSLKYSDYIKHGEGRLRPKKAKEDIIVYKVIRYGGRGLYYDLQDKNGKNILWSPGYQYTELGKTQICGEIRGGMLHSKKTYMDALKILYTVATIRDCRIVKMIIPKGTNYYENTHEYVSKSLIYPDQN